MTTLAMTTLLAAAAKVYSLLRKEAAAGVAAESLAMLALYATMRAMHEARVRFVDAKPLTEAGLAGFLRSLGQDPPDPVEPPVKTSDKPSWMVALNWWATQPKLRDLRLVGLASLASQRSDLWSFSAYQKAYEAIPELAELVSTPFMQQIIVTILHQLQAAASPAEPALKSELLALLESEAATNTCWAQLRTPGKGSAKALIPDRLDDVRAALDAPPNDMRRQAMLAELHEKADVAHGRLNASNGVVLTKEQLLAALVRVLARKPVRRFLIYSLWVELWIGREADKGIGRAGSFAPNKVAMEAAAISQALAVRMTVENVSKVEMAARGSQLMQRVESSSAKSPFAPYFEDPDVMSVLKAAPLSVRGGLMGFVHKTVQEYEAASGLVATLSRAFDASGASVADVEKLIAELTASAERMASEADAGKKALATIKARPVRQLIEALAASPLSHMRLAREDGSVIEEQVCLP